MSIHNRLTTLNMPPLCMIYPASPSIKFDTMNISLANFHSV